MDAPARDPLGGHQWPRHRPGRRNDPGLTAASPTGVPVLLRHHAAGQKLQPRAPRSSLSAGAHPGGVFVQKHCIHPQQRPRSAALAAAARRHRESLPRQYPWPPLLYRRERRTVMRTHPTLDKLQTLRLTGMYQALIEQRQVPDMAALTFEERLGLLVDRELTERENRRLTTRLRQAKLRQMACIEAIDYRHPRGLRTALLAPLP